MKDASVKIHHWLYPLSWLYGAGVCLRNKLFDWGWLRSRSFDVPVICVGNIAVGGTGKTPHTEYLIKLLQNEGINVATLSRGYKRKSKGYILATAESSVQKIGDEPYQIKSKFPDIRVAVDENRCHGIEQLLTLKSPAVDAVLLDDAFQHRHVKAGLNSAMSLHAIVTAHEEGYDENMYLDAATRTKVEETGGANFIFVTKDNKVVTPKSSTILPSITRRSLMYVAEHYLGLEVEEREVYLDELGDFAECGLCGTAAVISPVGKIVDHGKEICFPSGMEEMGPVTKKLYETLTGIQMGHIEAPEGWICKIC